MRPADQQRRPARGGVHGGAPLPRSPARRALDRERARHPARPILRRGRAPRGRVGAGVPSAARGAAHARRAATPHRRVHPRRDDEILHARSAARLARRFGTTPPSVRLSAAPSRGMLALAIENAREGCVGESFAALTAHWQAATADDPDVRTHLRRVAADETRHAELAWEIDAWLRTRLAPRERAHLEAVRADELARIAVAIEAPPDAELASTAGLPPPTVARALHRAFAQEVARRA